MNLLLYCIYFFFRSRSWQARRVIFTSKLLVFGTLHVDEVIDVVPLEEIATIKNVSRALYEDDGSRMNDSEVENKLILQVETVSDGFNSGRVYRLRMKTNKEMENILADLTRRSIFARERAEAKGNLQKAQRYAQHIIDSNLTQRILALLIFAVRICTSSLIYGRVY